MTANRAQPTNGRVLARHLSSVGHAEEMISAADQTTILTNWSDLTPYFFGIVALAGFGSAAAKLTAHLANPQVRRIGAALDIGCVLATALLGLGLYVIWITQWRDGVMLTMLTAFMVATVVAVGTLVAYSAISKFGIDSSRSNFVRTRPPERVDFVRRVDGLTYEFVREGQAHGFASYKRVDFDIWCRRLPGFGWVVCDEDSNVSSRPFQYPGDGNTPPTGAWVSCDAERSRVYDLVPRLAV